ncbi:hypothetical protein [Pseudohongiella sp.]|uniref:Uncharacterized protein n=1 Tax=marine sediment metagenome TaxID=412755 RepID=A0A0F9Z5Y5_9ZZZZ|nr:hypothetical protein [Pseudohongiella sp.]HDZ08186.1 hypothetical protein [Pseudohongiella sp.]HEA63154.1 hypothetical protein [Pseudohongiella sp.]
MSDDHREPLKLPGPEKDSGKAQDELNAWLAWFRQLAALASALSVLATAEIRLASADLRRLFFLVLFFLPIVVFAWLGLSVCISWLVYSQSGLPGAGFFTFFVVQAAAVVYMWLLFKKYRRSLTLPTTRRYLDEIIEDIKHGP